MRPGRYPSLPTATIDDYLPEAVSQRHCLADLPEQWVLAESSFGPQEWPTHSTRGWTLKRHPALPLIDLHDAGGADLGWLIGYPVSEDGVLLPHGRQLTVPPRATGEWLDSLGGRWAAFLVGADDPVVRLDPCGSLPAVFVPRYRIVASTPHLVPYLTGLDDDVQLVRTMNIPLRHASGGYPLGLTPRHGVQRLLPNHELRLRVFDAVRFWPRGEVTVDTDVDEQVEQIGAHTARTITAFVREMPCSLPLTSGRDSRMLLATARQHASELLLHTSRLARATGVPDWTSLVDARVARDIARRNGLRHQTVPIQPATDGHLDEWVFRSAGMISAPRAWRGATAAKTVDSRRTRLLGPIGELGRARLWQPNDTPDTVITPHRLLAGGRVPVAEQTVAEVTRWLEQFPTSDAFTTLNAYTIEQRVGCWASMLTYTEYAGPGYTVFPMNHADVVRRMCSLPHDLQRSGLLPHAVIRHWWPQLLDVPFHRDAGMRRAYAAQPAVYKAQRVARSWAGCVLGRRP